MFGDFKALIYHLVEKKIYIHTHTESLSEITDIVMPNTQSQNIKKPTPSLHTWNSQSVYLYKTAKICRHTKHIVSRLLPSFPPEIQIKYVLRADTRCHADFPLYNYGPLAGGDPYYSIKLKPVILLHFEQLYILLVKLQRISAVLLVLFQIFPIPPFASLERTKFTLGLFAFSS